MNPRFALFAASLLLAHAARASVPYAGGSYIQNFDQLGVGAVDWTDNSTLPGWYAFQSSTQSPPAKLHLPSPAGTEANYAARGRWYNFGTDTDRALGLSPSTKPTGDARYGLALVNNTGATIHAATLSFVWERWFASEIRDKHNQTLVLEYSTNATSLVAGDFTAVPEASVTFTVQNSGGDTAWFPAPATEPRHVKLLKLGWAPGATLWLRWTDKNENGIDHGVGIDDVVFTALPSSAK